MHRCPTCSADLAAGGECPACAAATVTAPPDDAATRTAAPLHLSGLLLTLTRGLSAPPPPDAGFRFPAGTVLADRYRIVAPLGKGGMGEVYRADDLTLGQSVALKFLPEHVAKNPVSLERFRKEVAAARQVAHPHVCRVFDIGEAGGQIFLSMEFIPGDDLAGVLRKGGRLSSELAIDLARQVAAGLQAVHDEGLVHRDLKLANVMVDGKGRARLTDFGLAATAESISGNDVFSGTPAYQAPEQLGGGAISERTDVYALGLLAYELLTGRRPFDATDRGQLIELQKTKPAAPSTFDPTIPPEVDRIVLKCLAFDPKDRPASAHEVWRTLPGDAALNAAIAAGVTPTAEAVADAGGEGRLKRWVAVVLALLIILLAIPVGYLHGSELHERDCIGFPPDKLRQTCRRILDTVGQPPEALYTASGYTSADYFVSQTWRDKYDTGPGRADLPVVQRITPLVYFHREGPTPLTPAPPEFGLVKVTPYDPKFGEPGSAVVRVDGLGRLRSLYRIRSVDAGSHQLRTVQWEDLFQAAGLDLAKFTPCEPTWEWRVPHDSRLAWEGVYPERPSIPLRVEAATDGGEVVGVVLAAPWSMPADDFQSWKPPDLFNKIFDFIRAVLLPSLMLGVGGWLAYRNINRGTSDLRGASRLVAAYAALRMAGPPHYVLSLSGGIPCSTWSRKLSSHPAIRRFVFPLTLPGARRVSDTATFRTTARLAPACPARTRLSSSRYTTSSTQCMASIPQCPRMNPANSAAVPAWLLR